MQCPSCGTLNPSQARFCLGCGQGLINGIVCHICHTVLPVHARYCYHCGAFLAQATGVGGVQPLSAALPAQAVSSAPAQFASAAPAAPAVLLPAEAAPPVELVVGRLPSPRPLSEMLGSLRTLLPARLYEPLERHPMPEELVAVKEHLSSLLATTKTYLAWPVVAAPQPPGAPAGGMRRGVFLFGDVSGFTPLSEKLKTLGQMGAEMITALINNLFAYLVRVLFEHGGTLLKFGGDAMLGLFPVETEEEMATAVLRATQAALQMQAVMKRDEFAAIQIGGETRALMIKCGISAGPYFAAHIGTQPCPALNRRGTMAFVTTGHTVNQAEECEGHANPGQVVLSKKTYQLLPPGSGVEIGPVTRSPDENYCVVLHAPPLSGTVTPPVIDEPPPGELMAQITYLVERLDRLTPYLPPELIARIVTNPRDAKILPENRPLTTVMFVNYKGVSDLIDDLGETNPDVITHHLNGYFVHMAEVVEKYEGTLARMDQYAVGDRLVIFFGAPRAHEDDAVRAMYAALEMQEVVRSRFAALRTQSGVYRFEQRIGINTGHLFAGNVGAPDLRQEYTLMGDDINMAARLMSNCEWQKIFISKRAKELVENFVELRDRGELKVKGKEIRIHTFEVVGRRGQVLPLAGADRKTPLIGRAEAAAQLQQRGLMFLSGRGQIVALVGHGGLGKTRLAREFRPWLASQAKAANVLWVDVRALSFSEQMSYWTATQLLRGVLQVAPDATDDDSLYTLGQHGRELLGKESAMQVVPYLAYMMNLPLGDEWAWVRQEDPKVRQKQMLWAARELVMATARQRPLVIALDDLHWADAASLALIQDLLKVTDHAPLMFILIFRPQRDKGCWRLRDTAAADFPHRYHEIVLERLSKDQSHELLSQLLPGAEFDAYILATILTKTAGNPFYLEEVVRSLIDNGAVRLDPQTDRWQVVADKIDKVEVPDTLHAAIVARIDRLTEDARQALQIAAVIGRQFRLQLLRNVSKAEQEIDVWVSQLERGGMVHPKEISLDPLYTFPDALVQEVAYDSLLVQSRQQLHRRIGETLESIFADRLEHGCELLAHHFAHSDDDQRAVKYLEMAARKARNIYDNETAIRHYLGLLEFKRRQGDPAGQASVLYAMGVIAYEIGDYERARPWLQEAATWFGQVGDRSNEGWAIMYLGMVDLKQANYMQALRYHQQALELARARQDTLQEGVHLTNLARVTMRLGQYDEALRQFQRSLDMKRAANDLLGVGFTLFYHGLIHVYQERYDQAEAALQGAIEAWQQIPKNERVVSYYHYGAGILALARGQFERAEENLQQAYDLSVKLVLRAEMIEQLSALGQARLGLNKLDAAVDLSAQAVKLLAVQKDVEEAQQIYLNHYYVLTAVQDPAAGEWLQRAYDTMMDQAARIEEQAQRQIYLEQVRVNQAIMRACRCGKSRSPNLAS